MFDEVEEEECGSGDRALTTYADLISLLLAFFIVMFSVSEADRGKLTEVAIAVKQAFHVLDAGVLVGSSTSDSGLFGDLSTARREQLRLSSALTSLVKQYGLEGEIDFRTESDGIVISISAPVLFESASANLRPDARYTLDAIASLIREFPNDIRVAGHTDNVSPYPQWPSNWELSAARAVEVVKYFSIYSEIGPGRLSATGMAEYQPLFPNDSPEHREANRRVDILVVFESDEVDQVIGNVVPPIEQQIDGGS